MSRFSTALFAIAAALGLSHTFDRPTPKAQPRRRGRTEPKDTRPLGQAKNDGRFASHADHDRWFLEPYDDGDVKAAKLKHGWVDRHEMRHGRSGDKLARKARMGMVGVCHPKRKL